MNRRPKGASLIKKRAIMIGERKTAITMEDAFWLVLQRIPIGRNRKRSRNLVFAHVLFGKPAATRIKCGAGFFRDML
jgi:predicted DNA-binding ribbon-helix-helix protein